MVRSHYQPESYDQARPLYPVRFLNALRADWSGAIPCGLAVDLGAGTGLGTQSFLQCDFTQNQADWALVEPREELLAVARARFHSSSKQVQFLNAPAEALPLPNQCAGFVFCASSWHWFDPEKALAEVTRILKPGGLFLVMEYRFPWQRENWNEMNDWVRRQFNTRWKFQDQTPRGDLFEITKPVRASSEFHQKKNLVLFRREFYECA